MKTMSLLLLAGSLLLSRSAPVMAQSPTGSWDFVQLTDPQLGMTTYDEDMASLEQAILQINLLKPAFVVLCGDLVHKPNPQSVEDFLKITRLCTVPLHFVPGNHDMTLKTAGDTLESWRRAFGPDYYAFSTPPFRFIVMNTTLLKIPLAHETDAQLQWLTNELHSAVATGDLPVLVGHHPPFANSRDEPDGYHNLPHDLRTKLLNWCHDYKVKAVLTGHTHRTLTNRFEEMIMVSAEATSTNMDGHALGFRLWHVANGTLTLPDFIPLYKRPPPAPHLDSFQQGEESACIDNLRKLDAAKVRAGMERGLPNGAAVEPAAVSRFIKGGLESLTCPHGGRYELNVLGRDPTCSYPPHILTDVRYFGEFKARSGIKAK